MAIKTANNQSMTAITSLPSGVSAGNMVLLATETASDSATVSFTSNIDSTYKEYVFKFINMHPATDAVNFQFQASTNTGSSYGVTNTSTAFTAYHQENGADTHFAYDTGAD